MEINYVVMAMLNSKQKNPGRIVPALVYRDYERASSVCSLINDIDDEKYKKGSAYCVPLAVD